MTYFSGPTPPYSNPPIEPQYYQPSRFVISDITLGATTLVTTSVDHNYVVGQQVRTLIPFPYRTVQLNEVPSYVIAVPATNEVTLDVDSTAFDPFDPSPTYSSTQPQIVAIGDINTPLSNSSGRSNLATTVSGAFINISPL